MTDINPEIVKNILIINLGGIGDILLSTPALKAIRERYPRARISLVAVPRTYEIVKDLPCIDDIFLFDVEPGIKGLLGNLKALIALRAKRFDLAVNMRTIASKISAVKIMLLFKMINPKIKAGRDTEGRGSFFDIRINETALGEKHEMDYDIDTARALGAKEIDRNLKFEVNESDLIKVRAFLEDNGIYAFDTIIGVDLGGKPSHKWAVENFIETIEGIGKKVKCKFVIIGDKRDSALADKIKIKGTVKMVNAAGKLNIKEVAALIKMCSLYISNDTGTMHIAAILNVPLIAIFGPGFLTRFNPRVISGRAKVLYKQAPCAPCNRKTCAEKDCLKAILPQEAIDAALSFLQTSKG